MLGTCGLTIGLSGGVGSGKSTTAAELAKRLGGTVASFGDYVRHLAAELGEPPERSVLQRIGQEHVEANADEFLVAFMTWAAPPEDRPLIIDGVRHAAVDASLRKRAADRYDDYFLVVIDTAIHLRAARRHKGDERKLLEVEQHPVEQGAFDKLPAIADFVIDGDAPSEVVVSRLIIAAENKFPQLRAR